MNIKVAAFTVSEKSSNMCWWNNFQLYKYFDRMLRSYISEELSAKTTGMHEGSHLNYVVQYSKCTTFVNSDIIMYEESNNDQYILQS